jgi:hypothetical protein
MLQKALLISLFSLTVAVGANACVDCHWRYNGDGIYVIDCIPPGYGDHCEGSFSGGTSTCLSAGACNTCFDYSQEIPDCGPGGPDQNGKVLNVPPIAREASVHRQVAHSVAAELSR